MITKKLPISGLSDVEYVRQKQHKYSYAFRRLYKMFEESTDDNFIDRFKEVFSLNDIEYRSLVSEVKSFKTREEKNRENKIERIEELKEVLEDPKTSKRDRYKAMRSIAYHTRTLDRESTFGGIYVQRCLTRECNKKERDNEKIESLRSKFKKARILPFCIMGEANQKGNRFFDLSKLHNGTVIYKPEKRTKIEIQVKVSKNYINDITHLIELVEAKEISVQVRLSTDYLYISYDEEKLKGYAIDETSRRKDVKDIKIQCHPKEVEKKLVKELYKTYYDEQRKLKLKDKISDRCIAIDMNPTNIGWSVLDKTSDGVKVISCGNYDLSRLCKKSGKKSSDDKTKHLNNKRKYELTIIAKELFKTCIHYKCSSFIIEDLEFKDKGGKQYDKESNRLTKNVWNREVFSKIITRRCNETGVELVKVIPCYTSFIGNIQYKYLDATNASIEIGRRGLWKYEKGGFYPDIRLEDISTLEAKFGNVVCCSTDEGWVNIYKSLKNSFNNEEFSHRLRAGIEEVNVPWMSFSMNSYKSSINSIIFTNL